MLKSSRHISLGLRLALTMLLITAISMALLSVVALILVREFETKRHITELEGQADLYSALADQLIQGSGNLQAITPLLVSRSVGASNVGVRVFGSAGEFFGSNGEFGTFPSRIAANQLHTNIPLVIFNEDRTRRYIARRIEWKNQIIGVIEISQSTNEEARLLRVLYTVAMYATVVALLAAIGGSAIVARWLARLIEQLRSTTERIAGGDISERAVAQGPHEFQQLAHAVNSMTDQLAERLERIENQSLSQRRFYRDVSHELRTPLMALGGYVENLEDARNDAERKDSIAAMQREIQRLARLADELLRSDASPTFQLAPYQTFALDDLVRDVVEMLQPRAKRNYVELKYATTGKIQLDADRDRLKQAIINVLDNALRSTPAGGKIEVSTSQTANVAQIDIQDNGLGVPEALREAIWERGVRGAEGGSGLGLAIVRSIMQAHGGSATLIPSEQGAHIRLELGNSK